MIYSQAIVRTPGKNMVHGLSTTGLQPVYERALTQHARYIKALEHCGLQVQVLPPDERFPDSVFVEDTAVLTPRCAIITNPGAPSRSGETAAISAALRDFFEHIEVIHPPGTLDGGDVLAVGGHYFIGLSRRTNSSGAAQFIAILQKYGLNGETIPLREGLHLKSSVAYLEHNTLVVSGELSTAPAFQRFNLLRLPAAERDAANCLWINGTVLIPAGFPTAKGMIERTGFTMLTLDISEFQKLDGGLSCMSLRW